MTRYFVGLDLGQASDYTALVVIESIGDRRYHVRHLERARGMKYPEIVKRVADVLQPARLYPDPKDPSNEYTLIVDYTGVGRPVYDMLKDAGLRVVPLLITGGTDVTRDHESGAYRVPKRDLVGALLATLQSGRLKFARQLPDIDVLLKELANFRVKTTLAANETFEAWREGDHDDFVLAMAGAIWYAEHEGGGALYGSISFPEYSIGSSEF